MAKKNMYEALDDLDPHFIKEVADLSVKDLDAKLVTLAKQDEEIATAMEEDEDLAQKQAISKVAKQSYTIPLKANKLKRRVVVDILRSREA